MLMCSPLLIAVDYSVFRRRCSFFVASHRKIAADELFTPKGLPTLCVKGGRSLVIAFSMV
jgi:hypothetical protein